MMERFDKELTILIVDDEKLAREKLKKTVRSLPNTEVTGEAGSVSEAMDLLENEEPDLVLLDIHLGKESGFDLVPVVPSGTQIIFVTAYDKYAVRAFEINALDYLLKPVQKKRLEEGIKKIYSRGGDIKKDLTPNHFSYDDTIFITTSDVCKFLRLSSITSIDAEGSYSHIYEESGEHYLIHKSLSEWETILDSSHFIRIHRSHIVNKNYIEDVEKWFNYTYRVTVESREKKLSMSRRRASDLKFE